LLTRAPRAWIPGLILASFAFLAAACGGDGPTTPTPSTTLKVSSITPASASTTGGATVTISGSNFASDATVSIGGGALAQVTFVNSTTLTGVLTSRATGGVADVVVTSGGKSSTLVSGFTFVAPSGANQPPVISGIRGTGSRPNEPLNFGDLNETLALVATVTDNDTPAASLTYAWTGPGTFSAATASPAWTLPAAGATPGPATATLTVTETYTEGGVTHRNVSAPSTFTVQLHDSQKEILDLGDDFLTLFSQSNVATDTVLRGFSTTCDNGNGRNAERMDVDRARVQYVQDFSKYRLTRLPPVTFNFKGSCPVPGRASQKGVDACSAFTVHWEITYVQNVDSVRKVGTKEITDGTDYVSAVLENNQWRLCHSDFVGSSFIPTVNRYFVVSW
jgi:hypothetical protein